ncbi:hypothetical protein Ddye_000595 [Dipteronia dyeriana]|uniref:Uncharacterized protein n=1 Tax=Dipteronia dyeriana TaxID=168575 RepID=A0AAE0CSP9_9ROSI|nr:hypothetical protein Ddye_000595 [Dipteronia dyeriana]
MEKLKSSEEANYKPESAPKQRLLKESTKPAPPSRGSEKKERLKSAFCICKPQGTFLRLDMAMSPPTTVVVPFDNLLVASTPYSSSHLLPPIPQPVKPFSAKPLPSAALT